jgi:tetratricopeptide (TPR) repeat protein
MGFSQIRHTTLVSLLAGFFLPLAFCELLGRFPRLYARAAGLGRRGWIPGLVLLGVLLLGAAAQGNLGVGLKASVYPVAATDFLKEHKLPGNLYNAYDWGGYLMWRLFPDTLVFVDGRSDSIEHFVASSRIENAWEGWSEALDAYRVNTIITRTCYYDTGEPLSLIDALVRHPGWSLVYRDEVAVIYVRRGEGLSPQKVLAPVLAYETMLAEAQRLYDEDPRYRSQALLAMGRASFHLQRFSQALDYYRNFLEIEPDNREARLATSILEARRIGQ